MIYMQRPLTMGEVNKVLRIFSPPDNRAPTLTAQEKAKLDLDDARDAREAALDRFVFSYKGLLEETGPSYTIKKMAVIRDANDNIRGSQRVIGLVNDINGWHQGENGTEWAYSAARARKKGQIQRIKKYSVRRYVWMDN